MWAATKWRWCRVTQDYFCLLKKNISKNLDEMDGPYRWFEKVRVWDGQLADECAVANWVEMAWAISCGQAPPWATGLIFLFFSGYRLKFILATTCHVLYIWAGELFQPFEREGDRRSDARLLFSSVQLSLSPSLRTGFSLVVHTLYSGFLDKLTEFNKAGSGTDVVLVGWCWRALFLSSLRWSCGVPNSTFFFVLAILSAITAACCVCQWVVTG